MAENKYRTLEEEAELVADNISCALQIKFSKMQLRVIRLNVLDGLKRQAMVVTTRWYETVPKQFKQEYMNEFHDPLADKTFRLVFLGWCWYYTTCERYDNMVCMHPKGIPVTKEEVLLVNRHAKVVSEALLSDLEQRLPREIQTGKVLAEAKQAACRLSDSQQQMYADLYLREKDDDSRQD